MSSNESWKEESLKRFNFVKLQIPQSQHKIITDYIEAASRLNEDERRAVMRAVAKKISKPAAEKSVPADTAGEATVNV